ncbi:MAG: DegV family protein [Actinobacteria bacterium]|nr:DegV family protein [Actinomycetota bacterium]
MQLDAGNTAVVLDSTADFPEGPERFPSWRVVPLYVRFGADSYRDYVDLGPADFYARLREAPELPTTSQPTPADFASAYEDLADYERIYSLHIPRKLSGTWQSASTAAEQTGGGRARVIDTGTVSAGTTLLALAIQRRLERGTTDEEIGELIDRFRAEHHLIFTLDTLEFLARGGRIGKARGMAGQLLHIKPIMTILDGEVEPLKKVRGNRRAFKEFQDAFLAGSGDDPGLRVAIAHAEAPTRLAQLAKLVQATRPRATIEAETTLGPVIGTHAGPGTVGLFWFADE